MKAMLLTAGLGTRLRPFAYVLPKPMIPLLNRPLIAWIVERAIAAGVRELIVNLHHFPEAIESYLPAAFPDASFTFSHEPALLGTGGGVRKVRALLEGDEDFLLANGDTLQHFPFEDLRAARRATNALAALTLRHPPPGDTYTAVWLDGGRITGFGKGTGEALMFSGSHCVSSRIFELLPDRPVSELVSDVYVPAVANGSQTLAGVPVDDPFWFDIGTPQRYLAATQALLGAESRIDATAHVTGSTTRSVTGARSVVRGVLCDSVVWEDSSIGGGVSLTNCIVGHGVELASGRYTNSMICRDDPRIPSQYVRQGGCVVNPF
jgi:mannose-1-phosphate guanylyltransferase